MEINPGKRYSLDEFLDYVEEPNRSRVKRFHEDYRSLVDVAKGSKVKHQAWQGGYRGHLEEGSNIAALDYWAEENILESTSFRFRMLF